MKLSVNWLKEFVDFNGSIDLLAESLSMAGFEVDEILDLSKQAKDVVIGYVLNVGKHPNAEKLQVCEVDIGSEQPLQIVCGAANVRKGVHVLVAVVGASLSAIPLTIKESKIRGVKSQGMICSLKELGLPSNSDGIEILEESNKKIPSLGSLASSYLGLDEYILDIAITANRPDGMSTVGLAREISTLLKSNLNIPKLDISYNHIEFNPAILEEEAVNDNGIYSIAYIENIDNNSDLPNWLNNRISSLGINIVNPVVDLTNYIMLEQGQPLHAFDADSLEQLNGNPISEVDFGVRKARKGEKLDALDNNTYDLNENVTVVTCCDKPVAIAGLIGSKTVSVSNKTTRIWLESALFSQSCVRENAKEIGIRTESSSRFEKGLSSFLTVPVLNRSCNLIKKYLKSDTHTIFCNRTPPVDITSIYLRRERVHQILGQVRNEYKQCETNKSLNYKSTEDNDYREIKDEEILDILKSLEFELEDHNEGWKVIIPHHRGSDIKREIDLIEELARLIGYDKFNSHLPDPIQPGFLNPIHQAERILRKSFCNNGFTEVVTSSLVSPTQVTGSPINISNPLFVETSSLRTNLWKEHLNVLKRNIASGSEGCWIFEIGKIYLQKEKEYCEKLLLTGALTGKREYSKWQSDSKDQLDYYYARGRLKQALDTLNVNITDFQLIDDDLLHPGRSANLMIEGKNSGRFGQLHPEVSEKYDLTAESYVFEIELNTLLTAATRKNKWNNTFKPFPTVPSMERDIAFVHSKDHSSNEILSAIKKAGNPLLENAELIDRYEGSSIPQGLVSQAFRITYRDKTKTLSDEDINPIHEKIRKTLVAKFDAELRS